MSVCSLSAQGLPFPLIMVLFNGSLNQLLNNICVGKWQTWSFEMYFKNQNLEKFIFILLLNTFYFILLLNYFSFILSNQIYYYFRYVSNNIIHFCTLRFF